MGGRLVLYRLGLYAALMLLCFPVIWVVHNSATDATWVSRQLYPVELWVARGNAKCAGAKQEQLRPLLWAAAREAGSLASQLAYVTPDGRLSHCTSAAARSLPDELARYRYASLTKVLTAQAVLEEMTEAGLTLDVPLSRFITQIAEAEDKRWQAVTIGQLLNHSGGLDRLRTPDPMTAHARTPWCPGDLKKIKTTTLDFDPGNGYAYSNLTYCLLGLVVEQLSGTNFRRALEGRFRLASYNIRFVDGPYLPDEINYDFRHAGFYDETYWRYLDFAALSSSAGLSGSAIAIAILLSDLHAAGRLMVVPKQVPKGCDPAVLRDCYGPALFPYLSDAEAPLLWVQQGYLFGTSSLLALDNSGAVLVWLGNGSPAQGTGADVMLKHVYDQWERLNAQSD